MQRHRILIIFGVAWISALVLSWWVFTRSSAPQSRRDLVYVAAAARDLPLGRRLQAEDVKLVALERKDVPKEVFLKPADLVDRFVAVPMAASETILGRKLSAKGSGEGLSALIEPGFRAISVQVNEVSGVSGFIQPGSRVDVLFTRVFQNGDAATTTILQNVKVIAFGRKVDAGAAADPRDNAKPTVATLLVTGEQAEKLVLGGQRGRIQLVLRNSLDEEVKDLQEPIRSEDLGIEEPPKAVAAAPLRSRLVPVEMNSPPPVQKVVPPPAVKSDPREQKEDTLVRIFRGEKVTEVKFE